MHAAAELLARNTQLTANLLDLALDSVVVLLLPLLLCACWRKTSAATRHLVWSLGLLSLGLLPLIGPGLSGSPRPLWHLESRPGSADEVSFIIALGPGAPTANPRNAESLPTPVRRMGPVIVRHQGPQLVTHFRVGWARVLLAGWLGGVGLLWAFAGLGCVRLRDVRRGARPMSDTRWRRLLREAREQLGIKRTVLLLQSQEQVMPVTWGWLRPVILLPKAAIEWDSERGRIVLLHELAHVRRCDCLTQAIAAILRGFYWVNPLAWLAARRMSVEREGACDDVVLAQGCRASEYASHLLEIARTARARPLAPAVPMARSSTLNGRIKGIVAGGRVRGSPGLLTVLLATATALTLVVFVAAQKAGDDGRPWFDTRLRGFFVVKAQQANGFAAQLGQSLIPEVRDYFDAGIRGDWATVNRLFAEMSRRRGLEGGEVLHNRIWSPVLETHLAWQQFAEGERRYVVQFGEDILSSIPPGSIYLARSDPGRALVTLLSQAHAEGNPFFTLAQNAFADGNYLEYLRAIYGDKLRLPSNEDSQKAFQEYVRDAQRRLHDHKLRPGENVVEQDNRVQISGPTAVMQINALLSRWIFEHNPAREFYVEESGLVEWIYPHLSPQGLLLRLNRQPAASLPEDVLQADHEYWGQYLKPLIGDWLTEGSTVEELIAFVERVYLHHDYSGFTGDRAFVENRWAQIAFSRLRLSISGLYVWRMEQATTPAEKARMGREANFALRQALALCPSSLEAVRTFANLLKSENRAVDSDRVLELGQSMEANAELSRGDRTVERRETILQSLKQLQAEWAKAQSEAALAQSIAENADEVIKKSLPLTTIPQVASDPAVQVLQRELVIVEAEFAELKIRYKSKHPFYMRAAEKTSSLRESISNRANMIIATVRNQAEIAKATEEQLRQSVDRAKKQFDADLKQEQRTR